MECECAINFDVVHLVKAHNHFILSNATKFKHWLMKSNTVVKQLQYSNGPPTLTLPLWCMQEIYVRIKINSNFYFHTSLWCLKRFYEGNTISLSCHEQVCLIGLRFERFFSRWWEKYPSKCSLIKHTCSWCDKTIALWTLKRQAKIFLRFMKA